MPKSYVGDIGTRIRTTLNTDLTGNTTLRYEVQKPDLTTVQWTLTVEDITNGIVYYDILSGDFNQAGRYNIQVFAVLPSGTFFGETNTHNVFALFN